MQGNIIDAILTWNEVALEVQRRDFSPDEDGR